MPFNLLNKHLQIFKVDAMDSHAGTTLRSSRPGDYGHSTLKHGEAEQHRPNTPTTPRYCDNSRDIHDAFNKTKTEILRDRRSWHYL